MDPDFFPFVIHCRLLAVQNMHDTQIFASYFWYINRYERTQSFASINMYFEFRWDNLSYQDFNSCCKVDSTSGNMILSIFLVEEYWIHWYNPLRKLELIRHLEHSLIWVAPWWLSLCLIKKNLMMYFVISGWLVFISTAYTILLCL